MSSSLGLYIEENLIKYAKVSKNNDDIKVESFGIKFAEKPEDVINQIIEETYSYKVPISVNLAEETYNYFDIFDGLKPKDKDGIVKTNFENYCYDKGLNKESYETRHFYTDSALNKERKKAIHIAVKKTSIARRKNQLSGYKVNSITPNSCTIKNIVSPDKQQDILIVNMEENTTLTRVKNNNINDIRTINFGSKKILDNIKSKENSYSKAYEICKNTSIYTNEGSDLQSEENEFLPDIMPTLYEIVTAVQNYVNESLTPINTIYLTGTLSVINNIDIYFQEYIKNVKCEILKPYFVSNNSKINIKDYVEVNSALGLAIQGIDNKNNNINFTRETGAQKLFGSIGKKEKKTKLNEIDIWDTYDKFKGPIFIGTTVISTLLVSYIIISIIINIMYNNKNNEAQQAISDTNSKIAEVNEYNTKLNNRITKYKNMVSAIEEKNNKIAENKRYKNLIPNLMNNIMAVIPKEVQLLSMENTNDTHMVITCQSKKYEQLAYFKTKVKNEGILNEVVSDTGVASGSIIKVTIEGELP